MTFEAIITRKLNVRFIDARTLEIKAKLNLDIEGYPSDEKKDRLLEEVLRIFNEDLSESEREQMQLDNSTLISAKTISDLDSSSRTTSDNASICSSSFSKHGDMSGSKREWMANNLFNGRAAARKNIAVARSA